jgi:hypothetical protein
MRLSTFLVVLVFPVTLSAQGSPCPQAPSGLPQFDRYKPSHLSIIRNYGGTMLAHAPVETLLKLDPYVPTEAALLRQLGGSIPVWLLPPFAWHPPMVHASPCVPVRGAPADVLTTFSDVVAELAPSAPSAGRMPTRTTSDRNRGISIEYDGRVWISAGPAVAFNEMDFVRVGDRAGTPIYQRVGAKDGAIYIPTTAGVVAPFKAER